MSTGEAGRAKLIEGAELTDTSILRAKVKGKIDLCKHHGRLSSFIVPPFGVTNTLGKRDLEKMTSLGWALGLFYYEDKGIVKRINVWERDEQGRNLESFNFLSIIISDKCNGLICFRLIIVRFVRVYVIGLCRLVSKPVFSLLLFFLCSDMN